MLVRRRGPRRIPGPRRPHPCGKDIMIFSLSDFFGYSMAVTSACDYLNLSPEDFHNWQVRLDGVRFISGSLSYDVSLRQLEKPAKGTQGKPKKKINLSLQARKNDVIFLQKRNNPIGGQVWRPIPDEVIIHALRPAGPLYLVFGCWAIIGGFFHARLCFCSLFELC